MPKQNYPVLSAIRHDEKDYAPGKSLALDTEADALLIEALTAAGALGEPAPAKGKKDDKPADPPAP
jgi:hypothetical protein